MTNNKYFTNNYDEKAELPNGWELRLSTPQDADDWDFYNDADGNPEFSSKGYDENGEYRRFIKLETGAVYDEITCIDTVELPAGVVAIDAITYVQHGAWIVTDEDPDWGDLNRTWHEFKEDNFYILEAGLLYTAARQDGGDFVVSDHHGNERVNNIDERFQCLYEYDALTHDAYACKDDAELEAMLDLIDSTYELYVWDDNDCLLGRFVHQSDFDRFSFGRHVSPPYLLLPDIGYPPQMTIAMWMEHWDIEKVEGCDDESMSVNLYLQLQSAQRLSDYYNDRWTYIGVVVTLFDEDGEEVGEESTWGIESDCADYIVEVANELSGELVKEMEKEIVERERTERHSLMAAGKRDLVDSIIANYMRLSDSRLRELVEDLAECDRQIKILEKEGK